MHIVSRKTYVKLREPLLTFDVTGRSQSWYMNYNDQVS